MKSLAENQTLAIPESKREYFPSLRLNGKLFPEIKDMEVGDTVKLSIEAKITEISKREGNPIDIRLELRKGEIKGDK